MNDALTLEADPVPLPCNDALIHGANADGSQIAETTTTTRAATTNDTTDASGAPGKTIGQENQEDNNKEDEEEDLYGDLDHAKPAARCSNHWEEENQKDMPLSHNNNKRLRLTNEDRYHAATDAATAAAATTNKKPAVVRSLVQEVEYLQSRVQQLEQENDILKRNMGTLYRTAVAELKRKDNQLQESRYLP